MTEKALDPQSHRGGAVENNVVGYTAMAVPCGAYAEQGSTAARYQPPPLPAARVQAAALRAAFPAYVVNVIACQGERPRYEVVRRNGNAGLYCLISSDAREIWHELCQAADERCGTTARSPADSGVGRKPGTAQ
jgi:hypothetical protein